MINSGFRRFVVLAFVVLFSIGGLSAQKYGRHPFDLKNFNLGFLIGLNYNGYNLKEQIDVIDQGILLREIAVNPKYGLTLGMITNFRLGNDHLSLRIIPSISLEQRDFDYFFSNKGGTTPDSSIVRKIESSYFNLPVLLQMKTFQYDKARVYVLAGAQLGFNLSSNKKVRDDLNLLKVRNEDISLVVGAGLNLYGDRIKLSPEIRYSIGLINIYEPEFTSHAGAISQLFSQVLTLNINFE